MDKRTPTEYDLEIILEVSYKLYAYFVTHDSVFTCLPFSNSFPVALMATGVSFQHIGCKMEMLSAKMNIGTLTDYTVTVALVNNARAVRIQIGVRHSESCSQLIRHLWQRLITDLYCAHYMNEHCVLALVCSLKGRNVSSQLFHLMTHHLAYPIAQHIATLGGSWEKISETHCTTNQRHICFTTLT